MDTAEINMEIKEMVMELEDKINSILAEVLGLPQSVILPDLSLVKDLGADSLDFTEIALVLGETYDITIPNDAVEGINTVSDVYEAVRRLLGETKEA
jgi:acyl carrier protein